MNRAIRYQAAIVQDDYLLLLKEITYRLLQRVRAELGFREK